MNRALATSIAAFPFVLAFGLYASGTLERIDVFEAIPEELIVKAALVAAAQTLAPAGEAAASCCEPAPSKSECCAPVRADSIRTSHDGARSNKTGPRSGKPAAR